MFAVSVVYTCVDLCYFPSYRWLKGCNRRHFMGITVMCDACVCIVLHASVYSIYAVATCKFFINSW